MTKEKSLYLVINNANRSTTLGKLVTICSKVLNEFTKYIDKIYDNRLNLWKLCKFCFTELNLKPFYLITGR